MITALIVGVPAVLAGLATWLTVELIKRAEKLTPEEQAIVDLFGAMRAEDTGGLIALPTPGTTVKITPADRRAAVRTLTVHHQDTPGVAVLDEAPASGPAATLGGPDVPGRDTPEGLVAPIAPAGDGQPGAGVAAGAAPPSAAPPVPAGSPWPHDTGWYAWAAITRDALMREVA